VSGQIAAVEKTVCEQAMRLLRQVETRDIAGKEDADLPR
jgi:hypothetical protein